MMNFYAIRGNALTRLTLDEVRKDPASLVWVDLCTPTSEEEKTVETLLATDIPTRDEMKDIELSSRLYQENGNIYATATVIANADSSQPETEAVTFVLLRTCLATIRYAELKAFDSFTVSREIFDADICRGNTVLTALLEAIVNRLAEILENSGHRIDSMTQRIFRSPWTVKPDMAKPNFPLLLQEIGGNGDLVSKTRESLVSLSRAAGYISQTTHYHETTEEHKRLKAVHRDLTALADHASFLSNKLSFLLDATLGMITNEQNGITKIVSVAAVVFLPPTLVASIYGMNFHIMPELDWHFGYPLALGLMVLAGLLPYAYFKKRKWL